LVQEHTNTWKVVPSYNSDAEEQGLKEGTSVLLGEWFMTFRTTVMPSSSQSRGTRRILHGLQNLKMKAVKKKKKSVTAYLLTQHCNSDDFNSRTNTSVFNHLTPNGHFSGRTAPLTYRCCIFLFIKQIYVLNILNMLHTLSFFLFKMPFIS
jgi:hypothetical protein